MINQVIKKNCFHPCPFIFSKTPYNALPTILNITCITINIIKKSYLGSHELVEESNECRSVCYDSSENLIYCQTPGSPESGWLYIRFVVRLWFVVCGLSGRWDEQEEQTCLSLDQTLLDMTRPDQTRPEIE